MRKKYHSEIIECNAQKTEKGASNMNEHQEIPLTFKDFTTTYKWPNMGSLRKMAYDSEINGLSSAFVKFQKRRLVLPQTLFRLLRGQSNGDAK